MVAGTRSLGLAFALGGVIGLHGVNHFTEGLKGGVQVVVRGLDVARTTAAGRDCRRSVVRGNGPERQLQREGRGPKVADGAPAEVRGTWEERKRTSSSSKKEQQQLRTSRPRGRRRPDDPQCPEQRARASIGRCFRLRRLRFGPCCAVGSPDALGHSGWRASGFVRFVFSHHAASFDEQKDEPYDCPELSMSSRTHAVH